LQAEPHPPADALRSLPQSAIAPSVPANTTPPTRSSEPGCNAEDKVPATPLPTPAATSSGAAQQATQPTRAATPAMPKRRLDKKDPDESCGAFKVDSFDGAPEAVLSR
jgi:hypothetical protein